MQSEALEDLLHLGFVVQAELLQQLKDHRFEVVVDVVTFGCWHLTESGVHLAEHAFTVFGARLGLPLLDHFAFLLRFVRWGANSVGELL